MKRILGAGCVAVLLLSTGAPSAWAGSVSVARVSGKPAPSTGKTAIPAPHLPALAHLPGSVLVPAVIGLDIGSGGRRGHGHSGLHLSAAPFRRLGSAAARLGRRHSWGLGGFSAAIAAVLVLIGLLVAIVGRRSYLPRD